MPFVVTQNCIKCKYTDCVEVCPVDCFHEGPNMLVIDPDECIDCTLCEPECPIEAIMCDEDVPEDMSEFIELNAELSICSKVSFEIRSTLYHIRQLSPPPRISTASSFGKCTVQPKDANLNGELLIACSCVSQTAFSD